MIKKGILIDEATHKELLELRRHPYLSLSGVITMLVAEFKKKEKQ